jgi:hypothetical protein
MAETTKLELPLLFVRDGCRLQPTDYESTLEDVALAEVQVGDVLLVLPHFDAPLRQKICITREIGP